MKAGATRGAGQRRSIGSISRCSSFDHARRGRLAWHTPSVGGWARGVKVGALALLAAVVAGACQGEWRQSASPSPVRAPHVALLRTGKVLLVAGSGNSRGEFDAGRFQTSIWDPT